MLVHLPYDAILSIFDLVRESCEDEADLRATGRSVALVAQGWTASGRRMVWGTLTLKYEREEELAAHFARYPHVARSVQQLVLGSTNDTSIFKRAQCECIVDVLARCTSLVSLDVTSGYPDPEAALVALNLASCANNLRRLTVAFNVVDEVHANHRLAALFWGLGSLRSLSVRIDVRASSFRRFPPNDRLEKALRELNLEDPPAKPLPLRTVALDTSLVTQMFGVAFLPTVDRTTLTSLNLKFGNPSNDSIIRFLSECAHLTQLDLTLVNPAHPSEPQWVTAWLLSFIAALPSLSSLRTLTVLVRLTFNDISSFISPVLTVGDVLDALPQSLLHATFAGLIFSTSNCPPLNLDSPSSEVLETVRSCFVCHVEESSGEPAQQTVFYRGIDGRGRDVWERARWNFSSVSAGGTDSS
ncbi:hypothetical protein JCM5296_003314 [Sporobolomyces johnsonii]